MCKIILYILKIFTLDPLSQKVPRVEEQIFDQWLFSLSMAENRVTPRISEKIHTQAEMMTRDYNNTSELRDPLTVKWGQEASKVGSSSSGSKSGLSLGGKVRNKLQAIWSKHILESPNKYFDGGRVYREITWISQNVEQINVVIAIMNAFKVSLNNPPAHLDNLQSLPI